MSMKNKVKQCTCPSCNKLILGISCFFSSCHKWFHAACENATESDLQKNQWHSIKCTNVSKSSKKK